MLIVPVSSAEDSVRTQGQQPIVKLLCHEIEFRIRGIPQPKHGKLCPFQGIAGQSLSQQKSPKFLHRMSECRGDDGIRTFMLSGGSPWPVVATTNKTNRSCGNKKPSFALTKCKYQNDRAV